MTLDIDLTDVEAWKGGDILPPGNYVVEVVKAEEGQSKSGNPQLELELKAIEGDHKDGTIRDWITFSPDAAGRVKQVLFALGQNELDGKVSVKPDDLVGKHARIVVRNEPYDGKDRSKVKAYEAADVADAVASANGAKSDDDDLPF